jgi:hypothetical protein
MSFFEMPPAQETEPSEQPREPWSGPPNNVLGVSVPVDRVVAASDSAVVTVGALTVYGTGFEFEYLVRVRDEMLGELLVESLPGWQRRRRLTSSSDLPPELFRFGLEFSDGSRVTTLTANVPFEVRDKQFPPVMIPQGGGGTLARWTAAWWVAPVPPKGVLGFICEWPAAGLAVTRLDIECEPILNAAARAQELWRGSDQDVAQRGGHTLAQKSDASTS